MRIMSQWAPRVKSGYRFLCVQPRINANGEDLQLSPLPNRLLILSYEESEIASTWYQGLRVVIGSMGREVSHVLI